MRIEPKPGLMLDIPPMGPQPMWTFGRNVRFRLGQLETIGLWSPLRDVNDQQVVLPGSNAWRTIYTTPSPERGQILAGSVAAVRLVQFDPASTPLQGTRWAQFDVTPPSMPVVGDALPNPSPGRTPIPPTWWFSDQDDVVVGCRANVIGEPVYAWDRQQGSTFVPLAGSPLKAVGGGILNRILILLGCTSFTDPDPLPNMTVRWSDRFNFEDWTPTDTNISGELQLEGGSRIVGGGVTGFGVVAWTDRRMALLNETGSIGTVFARRYIDGGRGLMANRSWTEADGRVWWMDETRTLNVFDGGRPRQITNPLRYATIERLTERQTARITIEPNTEYGEIIIHYPEGSSAVPNRQLVYNYVLDAWSFWSLERTSWCNRYGMIDTLAVDAEGRIWRHDIDLGLNMAYLVPPTLIPMPKELPVPFPAPPVAEPMPVDNAPVEPLDWFAFTNPITMPDLTSETWHATRLHLNYLPASKDGMPENEEFIALITGYGTSQIENTNLFQDYQYFPVGDMAKDFRVSGKALQIGLIGSQMRSVLRFGAMTVTAGDGGAR